MPVDLLIIGISGVTCGGKTTLACHLKECLPKSHLISQDDYFLDVDDPRHTWIPELNHINFDVLSSLDMQKMTEDIEEFARNKHPLEITTKSKPHFQSTEDLKVAVYETIKSCNLRILIVEGFSIFNYKPLQEKFHLKYYFTLPKDVCFERRAQRVYEPPDCPGYFERCVWPEHEKQLEEVRKNVAGVKFFDGVFNNSLHEVLSDIQNVLGS